MLIKGWKPSIGQGVRSRRPPYTRLLLRCICTTGGPALRCCWIIQAVARTIARSSTARSREFEPVSSVISREESGGILRSLSSARSLHLPSLPSHIAHRPFTSHQHLSTEPERHGPTHLGPGVLCSRLITLQASRLFPFLVMRPDLLLKLQQVRGGSQGETRMTTRRELRHGMAWELLKGDMDLS